MTNGLGLRRLMLAMGLLSASVLGFEIVLLRLLQIASWNHFAFVVISLALLGFAASGTALCLLRRQLLAHGSTALWVLMLAAAVSMPIAWHAAQCVPIEARVIPALLLRQTVQWLLYWLVLSTPFLLGASAIGLALMMAGRNVPAVYGANLLGSGIGAVAATAAMSIAPPSWLPAAAAAIVLPAVVCIAPGFGRRRAYAGVVAAVIVAGMLTATTWLAPTEVRVDPAKYARYASDLAEQGDAERVAVAIGPRAVLETYRGDAFHHLPFLGPGSTPPPLAVLLADGHLAGTVLEVADASEAMAMDQTLMALPYALAGPGRRVLLLGERGGSNIWLALRNDAAAVDVVQPDANVFELLRGPMHRIGGAVLDQPSVRTVTNEPRHFVQHGSGEPYDLVQLTMLESSAAGTSGIAGLAQDNLITVEGMTACLRRLTPTGMLFVCRGIQTPPRDNVKLLAVIVSALRRMEVGRPEDRVVIVRDFQAICTMVRRSPWTAGQIQAMRQGCEERQLTPVWFSGIRDDELNQPDELPGPTSSRGDWYHHAAVQLFSDAGEQFIEDWPFDIRPPTDDRPFFANFCRPGTIGRLRDAFGQMWLTRIELALLFVFATLIVAGIAGALLIVAPLLLVRAVRRQPGKWPTSTYFAAIGLAYLLLEMTALSKLTHLVGDPVRAAAITIGSFLVLSGVGSLMVGRIKGRHTTALYRTVLGLVAIALILQWVWPGLIDLAGGTQSLGRVAVAVAAIAPLAVLMGIPMPLALARVDRNAPLLFPWAWAVNGFASVMAAPLAMALGMTCGFHIAGGAALVLYVCAAAVYARLPGGTVTSQDQ